MKDKEPRRNIVTRRTFLTLFSAATAEVAIASCTPSRTPIPNTPTPTPIPTLTVEQQIEALVQNQKLTWTKEAAAQNLQQKAKFTLQSGLNITVFSQGGMDVAPEEFDKAFNAGFAIVQNFKEKAPETEFARSPFTIALLKAQERMLKSDFKGREALVMVSADPNTCIDINGRFVSTSGKTNPANLCATGSLTMSAIIGPKDQTQSATNLPEAKLSKIILTAGAIDDITVVDISPNVMAAIDPQTALGLALSFEGMRTYLRMLGGNKSTPAETEYLNTLKILLLTTYALHPDIAFQPFTAPKPKKTY